MDRNILFSIEQNIKRLRAIKTKRIGKRKGKPKKEERRKTRGESCLTIPERQYRHLEKEQILLRVSVLLLLGIGVGEAIAGLYFGSIALVADGIHSLADSVVSMLVLTGILLSRRRPDMAFSHGYARAENLFGLLAAIVMIALGGLMLYESYLAALDPAPIRDAFLAIAVAVLAGSSSLVLALMKIRLSKKSGSLALKIEAYNSVKDGLSSFVVVAGIGLASLGLLYFDALAGIAISVMIIAVGYVSVKESSVVLMDGCLCPGLVDRFSSIALSVEGVLGIRDVRLRKVGRSIAGQATVRLDGSMTVAEAHRVTEGVKKRIINEFGDISDIVLEIEPSKRTPSRA
ncbi:MAG: cation transporter [Candidatus Methanosuratus sp.]|nr:cation transporter [Candidatus Methanosuratincola sp.]